ncbi:MAG: molecular chaperone DnaJ [Candidatus Thorarchaeota archaeon]
MADEDYYELLGVARTATPDEIKKAYRKLARELHPDRNPGDKKAEDRLKVVNAAYDVLSDPQKKATYDQYGTADFQGVRMDDIGAVFDQLFRQFGFQTGRRTRETAGGPPQGESLRVSIPLTFDEAFFGIDKEVAIRRKIRCEVCSGSGAAPGTSPVRCSTCGGRGQVTREMGGFMRVSQTCPTCRGIGESIDSPCKQCKGSGTETTRMELKVPIPAGIENGVVQRIRGAGNAGPRGGPPGDLIVIFQVEPHETFTRKGLHVFMNTEIPFSVAALGGEIEVPTMWGVSKLRIKKGTMGGSILRMKGKGVHADDGRKGDQLLQVEIHVPDKLSKAQERLLRKLEEEHI